MKNIEELIDEDDRLWKELKKIPKKQLCALRSLTSIYVLTCLEGNDTEMGKQRERVEKYINNLENKYNIEPRYFRTALNNISSYYNKMQRKKEWRSN